jgi:hypothetical protein
VLLLFVLFTVVGVFTMIAAVVALVMTGPESGLVFGEMLRLPPGEKFSPEGDV